MRPLDGARRRRARNARALLSVLGAAAFLVAALVACASLERRPEQRAVIAPLYSVDLLGSRAGSIVATLLLIPVTGLVSAVTLTLVLVVLVLLLT